MKKHLIAPFLSFPVLVGTMNLGLSQETKGASKSEQSSSEQQGNNEEVVTPSLNRAVYDNQEQRKIPNPYKKPVRKSGLTPPGMGTGPSNSNSVDNGSRKDTINPNR